MRLINPGPGELLDRKTILRLKVDAAYERQKPISHFEEERFEIVRRLHAFEDQKPVEMVDWEERLLEVNRRIWVAIDELRASASGYPATAAHWGLEAMRGNDRRAQIIHEINAAFGVADGAEKVT